MRVLLKVFLEGDSPDHELISHCSKNMVEKPTAFNKDI